METVAYLTLDQIVDLHDRALAEEGGLAGVRSYQALASVVDQVQQSIFGEDAHPTLAEKAAAYAFFIAMGHPFNDGNKRTAVASLDVFLGLNGYELDDADEFEDTIVSLAAGLMDRAVFIAWVVAHMRPSTDVSNVTPFAR